MDNMFSVASRVSLKVVPASHLSISLYHTHTECGQISKSCQWYKVQPYSEIQS